MERARSREAEPPDRAAAPEVRVYSALRTRRNKQHKPLHISRSAFRWASAPLWTIKTTTHTAKAVRPRMPAAPPHLVLPGPPADETTAGTTEAAAIGTMIAAAALTNRRPTAPGAMTPARSPIGRAVARISSGGIGASEAAAAIASSGLLHGRPRLYGNPLVEWIGVIDEYRTPGQMSNSVIPESPGAICRPTHF